MKKETIFNYTVIILFLLSLYGCSSVLQWLDCSGGIDGHTHTFSDEEKRKCGLIE